jgi:hypothetical protein
LVSDAIELYHGLALTFNFAISVFDSQSCGSARALAQFLVDQPPPLPLLFLSGNQLRLSSRPACQSFRRVTLARNSTLALPLSSVHRRLSHLPDALRDAGVAFEELTVYRTLPLTLNSIEVPHSGTAEQCPELSVPAASESLAPDAIADDGSATWLAFFSPSGVAAATEAFGAGRLLTCQRAAIGPTTAAALAAAHMHAHAVAERPAPDALRAAIERAIAASVTAQKAAVPQ